MNNAQALLGLCLVIAALILPIHFPSPTVRLIKPLGDVFDYRFKRE